MNWAEDRRRHGIRIRLDRTKQPRLVESTVSGANRREYGRRSKNETDTGTNRCHGQRDGPDRARSLPVDYVRSPGWLRLPIGNVDVGGNFGRASARLRDRGFILGAG